MTGTVKRWAVADGRRARGVVDLVGGEFVAIDTTGMVLGRFATLAAAAAAFDADLAEDGE
jgi:hypothetical protein